jgi:hypothetical protein
MHIHYIVVVKNTIVKFLYAFALAAACYIPMNGSFFSLLETGSRKNNIAVLDGVRALACLAVMAFHIDVLTLEMPFHRLRAVRDGYSLRPHGAAAAL